MQRKSKWIQVYMIEYKLPLKPSHKDGRHQSPPPRIVANREASRGLVKISANCLFVSMYLNVSLLYMISQEVVSPLKVSHFLWKTGFLATEMAMVLSHMRGTLSKITPKSLMVCRINRIYE
jgi:hypothetical protein